MSSFKFNDTRKPYLLVTHRVRRYWAPRELVLTENRRVGSRLRHIKTGVRVEEVHVEISDTADMDIKKTAEDFAEWLLSDTEKELVFDDEIDRSYYAIVDGGFDAEEIVRVGYGVIRFVCPDPYKSGRTRLLNLSATAETFVISGQIKASWTSRTVFEQSADQFVLETGPGKVTLNYEFIAGDVLDIDYTSRRITLNGESRDVALSLDSVWEPLPADTVELKASHNTEIIYVEKFY